MGVEHWDIAARFLVAPNIAFLATTSVDGSPHVAPIWVSTRDERVVMTSNEGTAKLRNVRRDPRVAIAVHAGANPLRAATVFGHVERETTGDEAIALADEISLAYDGQPWDWAPGERERCTMLTIAPDRVVPTLDHA
ncbi:MAG: TIGR03618 family F420-dependent PPOX class oxidoreductase [Actinomycetota bacterium]